MKIAEIPSRTLSDNLLRMCSASKSKVMQLPQVIKIVRGIQQPAAIPGKTGAIDEDNVFTRQGLAELVDVLHWQKDTARRTAESLLQHPDPPALSPDNDPLC